jgi:hypothetical protein
MDERFVPSSSFIDQGNPNDSIGTDRNRWIVLTNKLLTLEITLMSLLGGYFFTQHRETLLVENTKIFREGLFYNP